jgi:2'-5' RNA ligase
MAAQIAAHVTVAYPQEAPISDLLVERVRAASAGSPPFRLRLGRVATFGSPEDGVYVTVEDIDGGYRTMREEVLRPPFHGVAFPPHVTLVHPRTSGRGRDFRNSGWSRRGDAESWRRK